MQLTRRYRNILALIVVQLLLFVLYGCHLHRNEKQRSTELQQLEQPQRQRLLDNWTLSSSLATEQQMSNEAVPMDGRENATDVGYAFMSTVELSVVNKATEAAHHRVSKTVSSTPLSADNTTASVNTGVRNKTLGSSDDNIMLVTKNTDYSTKRNSTDNSTIEQEKRTPVEDREIINRRTLYSGDYTLSFSKKSELTGECELSFLRKYSAYCEKAIAPALEEGNRTLCPCIPHTLVGETDIGSTNYPLAKTESEHRELSPGGHWEPRDCVPRQRVAIVVPFRDRHSHLEIFLRVLHPFLQRQMLHYTIFVVEQHSPKIFNKASLMNAGFQEIRRREGNHFDCFIFHDVDMLPETDRNFYGCYKSPRHVGAFVNKFKYNLLYFGIFGGATAFTEQQFEKVNGYSNEFYGWGGEDDDMFNRVKYFHQNFLRFPKCVARYKMIKHKRDESNPYDHKRAGKGWAMRPKVYKSNGLNSLVYSLVSYEEKVLFTRILISFPEFLSNDTSTTKQST